MIVDSACADVSASTSRDERAGGEASRIASTGRLDRSMALSPMGTNPSLVYAPMADSSHAGLTTQGI